MHNFFAVAASAALLFSSSSAIAASRELPKSGESNPVAGILKPKPTPVNLGRSRAPIVYMPMQSQDRARSDGEISGKEQPSDRAYASFRRSSLNFSGIIIGRYFAGELIGAGVKNLKGVEIGRVQDLLIGDDTQVRKAIVETGGFLGFGTRMVAIEIDRLTQVRGNNEYLFTAMTREQLEALPAYVESSGIWVRRSPTKDR